MPTFRVMRQKIIIEEAEVEAATEAQATRIAEAESHSDHPKDWRITESHNFILQCRRASL